MNSNDLSWFIHADARLGARLSMDSEDARHMRVLRLSPGDEVAVCNGKGMLFLGKIDSMEKQTAIKCESLLESIPDPPAGLHLAVAPTKNTARLEWVIEKATELQAASITPIICEHSERTHLKVNRMERIALAASKQSRRLWLPTIQPAIKWSDFLHTAPDHPAWIAHCRQGTKDGIASLSSVAGDAIVAIGPEGDFSETEIDQALAKGFRALDLGSLRLRTETAAITACIAKALFNG